MTIVSSLGEYISISKKKLSQIDVTTFSLLLGYEIKRTSDEADTSSAPRIA